MQRRCQQNGNGNTSVSASDAAGDFLAQLAKRWANSNANSKASATVGWRNITKLVSVAAPQRCNKRPLFYPNLPTKGLRISQGEGIRPVFTFFFFFSFRGINQNTEQWRRKYTKILNAFNIKASGIETQTSKNPAAQDHQQNATRRATAATSAEACGACKKRQLHENATQNQQNFRIERWEFFDKTLCFLLKSFQFCFLVPSQMV